MLKVFILLQFFWTFGVNVLAETNFVQATEGRSHSEEEPDESLNCQSLDLPGEWSTVYGNADLNTGDFCVMRFEAKAWKDRRFYERGRLMTRGLGVIEEHEIETYGCLKKNSPDPYCFLPYGLGGFPVHWAKEDTRYLPVSVPWGRPWRDVDLEGALEACSRLNVAFADKLEKLNMQISLISHKEWQAIANDIAKIDSNWSGGVVGRGCVNQGNIWNNQESDECSYHTGMPEPGSHEKATHFLSSGDPIYHFSGNIGEIVGGDIWNRGEYPIPHYVYYPLNNYVCQNERDGCGFGLPKFCGRMTRPYSHKPIGGVMEVWRNQEDCEVGGPWCTVSESGYSSECNYSSVSEWKILTKVKTFFRGREYDQTVFKIRSGWKLPVTARGGSFEGLSSGIFSRLLSAAVSENISKWFVSNSPGGIFSYEFISKYTFEDRVGFRCVLRSIN